MVDDLHSGRVDEFDKKHAIIGKDTLSTFPFAAEIQSVLPSLPCPHLSNERFPSKRQRLQKLGPVGF